MSVLEGKTQNISLTGIFFNSPVPWPVGTSLDCIMRIPLRGLRGRLTGIHCQGKVVRIIDEPDGSTGIGASIKNYQFIDLEPA